MTRPPRPARRTRGPRAHGPARRQRTPRRPGRRATGTRAAARPAREDGGRRRRARGAGCHSGSVAPRGRCAQRLGGTGCAGRVARLHADVGVRRQLARHRGPRRGARAHRRRRPSVPRCHLVALGHHPRASGAGARRGPARPDRPRRPHDDARARQHGDDRARRGPRGPGTRRSAPHAVRERRRGGRRAGPQDRLPALDQPGRRRSRPLPGLHRRLPRRLDRLALRRRRWLRHRRVRPASLPGRASALRRPRGAPPR